MAREYIEFINNNFKEKELFIDSYANKLYSRICESTYFFDLILGILNSTDEIRDKKYINLVYKYKNCFNRTLLYMSLGDMFGFEFCLRNSIENLLKLIYCITFKEHANSVVNIGFRNLKNRLISQPVELDNIKKLCNLYSDLSNSIHLKNKIEMIDIEFIQDSINSNINYKEVDNLLLQIINLFEDIFINILDINNSKLDTSDRLRLRKNQYISKRRKQALAKKLKII